MKLYTLYFRTPEKEFSPEKRYASKYMKTGPNLKIYLNSEGGVTVLEEEIKKYWDYGGGVEKCIYAGELDDTYFKPTLAEPDFVDDQIKSRKTGELIGYQG